MQNLNEIKSLLDKVTLQTLELVEEDVTLKLSIEKLMNEGTLNLAKTRYVQGSNSVSISQLPNDEREFCALRTVEQVSSENTVQFKLESHMIDKESNHVDPIHWFGILVPQTLKTARDNYEKAIDLIIESANVRQRIRKNYEYMQKLKSIKCDLEKAEE